MSRKKRKKEEKDPIENRKKNKEEQGPSRNLSAQMYGYEEGDEKPAAARGAAEAENTPTREGAIEKNTIKTGISYEPDKHQSGTQGGYGQGNVMGQGETGPQGYGFYKDDRYRAQDYEGQFRDKEEDSEKDKKDKEKNTGSENQE